jgi:O-antigen ligase
MIVPGPSSILALGSRSLLLFVIGTMPVLFGAVQAWVWPVYVMAIYASFVPLLWSGNGARSWRPLSACWIAAGIFLAITLIACLPLSSGWVSWLSPERWALLREAQDLSSRPPAMWTVSYAPLSSLAWWAFMLALALLFRVSSEHFGDFGFLKGAIWLLFSLAVIEALYGILQALLPNIGVLWVTYLKAGMGDARGTYINRNHFAGFLGMLLPLLLGFSLSRVQWGGRMRFKALLYSEHLHQHMLMVLGLVVIALALLFSKSRGGITGALLGLIMFLLFALDGAPHMRRAIWGICGLLLGLTLLYGLRIGFDPIIERFLALDQGQSRLDYWRDSLPMIAAHPFGIGLAAFKNVFPIYDTSLASDRIMAVYLHNDVLQLLVEAGWIGFCALAGAFVLFMATIFGRIRRMDAVREPERFFLATGAYGGLTALSVHSFFDFNLQIPANAVVFVLLMAIAHVTTRRRSQRR